MRHSRVAGKIREVDYGAGFQQSEREQYIRQRLSEAVQALRRSQFPERFFRRSDPETGEVNLPCVWPDIERERGEIWYAEGWGLLPGTRTRVLPTRAEISHMDQVLPWLVFGIPNPRIRMAVFLKAWPMGFRRIGQKLGVSHETARTWERQGIAMIAQHLAENT